MTQPLQDQPDSPQPTESNRVSDDQRQASLANAVAQHVASGKRVESQTPYNAILVTGNAKTNHTLHLILTIATLGLWGIVWLIMALTQKEHRYALAVDAFGNVTTQQLT